MENEEIKKRCDALVVACLEEGLYDAENLGQRLDVLTKVTRYLETVTPRLTFVRHIHEPQEAADPLAQTMTDPDPTGGLRK